MPYSKPQDIRPPRPGYITPPCTGYDVTRIARDTYGCVSTDTFHCRSFEPVCGGVRLDRERGGAVFISGGVITIKRSSGA